MKLHRSKIIERPGVRITTTLCGRMNVACSDGMNIAETDDEVTCRFCLKQMGAAGRRALAQEQG